MTNITVAICGLLYLGTSIGFIIQKQYSWALTYFAYSLANVGLILAAIESSK
jgi:heme O synthase-like polyprenyltransferase